MSAETIPDDVRRFVLTSIPSVPFLEALLLLHSHPGKSWSARDLSRRLYVSEASAGDLLSALMQAGFAVPAEPKAARYAADPDLSARVSELEHWYSVRLMDVTALIHSTVDKRAHQFADAFRWKKEG